MRFIAIRITTILSLFLLLLSTACSDPKQSKDHNEEKKIEQRSEMLKKKETDQQRSEMLEKKKIRQVFKTLEQATKVRDLDLFMSVFLKGSEQYDSTKRNYQIGFESSDIIITLDNVSIWSIKGNTAVVQATRREEHKDMGWVKVDTFVDEYNLIKVNNRWYISTYSEISSEISL